MIKEFTNSEYGQVRATLIDNTPCLCLKDICQMLDIRSVSDCRGKLDQDGIRTKTILANNNATKMLFITPENISPCLFQSKKVEAESICDWLYRHVLPKVIHYADCHIQDYEDPDRVVQLLDEYQELRTQNEILETNRKLNEPKIRVIDKLFGTNKCIDFELVHTVIKYHGIKQIELLKILRAHHIIDDDNVPLQEYCDRRHFRIVESKSTLGNHTVTSQRTYVYQSGIHFIEKIIKSHDGGRHARNNG
jgi:anti-repressor protein